MKVVDLMTNDPLTVTAAETVGKADELMAENNIRQIPVVNGRGTRRHRHRPRCPGVSQRRPIGQTRSQRTRLEDISGRYHDHGAAVHHPR